MNRDSIADYLSYILFKAFGFIIRKTPKYFGLFLGRRLGDLLYYCDLKHKAIVYVNIKAALGKELSPCQLKGITREFYRGFVQNIFEIFYIPLVDKEYFKKYVSLEGVDNIAKGFKRGKGVIFLAMHEGSWEISNIISSNIGFSFNMFVRDQKRYRRVENLLNVYRQKNGCKLIQRQNQIRQLIEVLKNNESVGMTIDQGGKAGTLVKFFGKEASMASGAVKLALKYDAAIIPIFYARLKGPHIKLIIKPPFEIRKTHDEQEDIRDNLQRLVYIFEEYIIKYPAEYLWTYKIWKYGKERNILILSDGKIGHLRQSQAVANIVTGHPKEKGFRSTTDTLEVENYKPLIRAKPDIIISCGSKVAPLNYILSRENLAKSVVIMRPSFLGTRRFDLAIIPEHDKAPKRKNIVATEGALNLINDEYLKEQANRLMQSALSGKQISGICIGLLVGGDSKRFRLKEDTLKEVIEQIKSVADKLNADILITTSRRTPREIENLLKGELKGYSRSKLLIIANEKNIPEAVGGILSLSQIVITSPESISMVSEAVSSKKCVFVFREDGLSSKHRRFLEHFSNNKYIYIIDASNLGRQIEGVWQKRPALKTLNDNSLIREAIKNIL